MAALKKVTDPEILKQLNENFTSPQRKLNKVTDPEILKQLNAEEPEEQGFLNKLPRNLLAGAAEGARGLLNIPYHLGLPYAEKLEKGDYGKEFGLTGSETASDTAIQTIGQFLPALVAPELQLGRAGEALTQIPKVGKFLKSALGNAALPSAYAATQAEESPIKEAGKTAAMQLPFTALMQGIANQNPFLRLASRLGLGTLGGAIGYQGAKELGLPGAAQASAAAAGSLLGLVGRNPTKEAQKDIAKAVGGTNYKEKLEAARRLDLKYLTPAEASGNPYLGAVQGNIGKTENGSKSLFEAGTERIKTEEKAIDKLLNTTYNHEKLSPEIKELYAKSYQKEVPLEDLQQLGENKIIQRAERIVAAKPAYQESLKGVDKNTIAYLDHVKQALDDMIGTAIKKGDKKEASIMQKTRTELLDKMDKVSPEYPKARALHERKEARDTIEKAFNSKAMIGTNLFRALQNKTNYNELLHHLRNVPEAQAQLKDMKLVFGDLINPPTVRTAAGTSKTGMNQERNSKKAYSEMLKQVLSFGKNDNKMVELITNPKWDQELKNIAKLSGYEKKLIATTRLLGRVTASANTNTEK